ncbi:MAG: ABC transporter permease [Acidobacteriaceae bacterium]|nr:ABC transporter permease [Acidobacteriaceae bacterium]
MRWWRTKRREQDLERELRADLELEAEEQQENGLSAREARYAAQRAFGNTTLIREEVRAMWTLASMERLIQDMRYALRTMRKNPAYSLIAAVTIALGIASTTLMFAVVKSVLLQPPPFKSPGALYMLWQKIPQEGRVSFSARNYIAYASQTQLIESLAAFTGTGFTILGRGEPELAIGQLVTPSFFTILGVAPSLGRTFLASEGEQGHNYEVVLSDQLWRSKFDGRNDVIGQAVVLNGDSYTIVGVMPATFDFPGNRYKLWVPAALNAPLFQQHPDAHFLRVLARLKPGLSAQHLQAELNLIGKRIDAQEHDPARSYYAVPLRDMLSGDLRRPLLILLSAVACLLIIACANVANLSLARATARNRELAVRGAIGASRPRLLQQLLVESTLLALIGGMAGFVVAYWGVRVLTFFAATNVPQLMHTHINSGVVGFAFVVSAICGIVSGLTPAFAGSQIDFRSALNEGTRAAGNVRSDRNRRVLVFAEIALCSLLLISSGLLIRSFVSLLRVNPGFQPSGVVTADCVLRENHYPDAGVMLRFYREALARMRVLPGIKNAAMITHLPFGGNDWGNSFEVEGRPAPVGKTYGAQIRPISTAYFSTMHIPLRRGRDFSEEDNEDGRRVAIINEKLKNQFWPTTDPIGQHIRFDKDWLTIIGVSGNVKHSKLDADFEAEIYIPYPQLSPVLLNFVGRDNNYVVASTVGSGAVATAVRATIHKLDPEMVVTVDTMEHLIDDSVAQTRFRTWLIVVFAALALALVCVGIYGLVSYTVTQRYRDFGIRIALGAERLTILQLALARSMTLTLLGVLVGGFCALLASRFFESLLFGITAHDPLTFASAPVLLILIALLASYIPARRATKIDPIVALRYE